MYASSNDSNRGLLAEPLLLQAFYHSITDAVITADEHFVITSWNRGAEQIYGLAPSEVIGHLGTVVFNYEFITSTQEDSLQHIREHGTWKGVVRFTRPDGQAVYLDAQVSQVKNEALETIGFIAVNRDITKSYLQTQALDMYASVLKGMEESFIIVDTGYRVVFIQLKPPVNMFYGGVASLGSYILEQLPVHRRSAVKMHLESSFAGTPVRYTVISPYMPGVYLEVQYIPMQNEEGMVSHVCTVIKDISSKRLLALSREAQRVAEEEAHSSRLLFELFMENAPLPSWITDVNGVMRYMSPAYLKVYGDGHDMGHKTIYELFSRESADVFTTNNMQVLASGRPLVVVEEAIDHNGNKEVYKVVKFPIEYKGERMIAGWALNISDQVQLRELLVRLEKERSRELVQSITQAIETERSKLAVALRDGINQDLTSCKLLLEVAGKSDDSFVLKASTYVCQSISDLKKITDALNPHTVEELGFQEAISQLAAPYSKQVEVRNLLPASLARQVQNPLSLGVYRILQGLLPIMNVAPSSANKIIVEALPGKLRVQCIGLGKLAVGHAAQSYGWKTVVSRIAYLEGKYEIGDTFTVIELPFTPAT